MRLYKILSAVPYFVGTQAEAKRDARGFKCDWQLEEVPTDKEGLIAYLNGMELVSPVIEGSVSADQFRELQAGVPAHEGGVAAGLESPREDRQGPKEHRLAERAAFLGTSEEVTVLTDRIGELDGWPLGQVALATATRLKELAS